jgi:hypothetical protein
MSSKAAKKSKGDVVSLYGHPLPQQTRAEIVQMFEAILEQAKRGEIISAACVVIKPNGNADCYREIGDQYFALMGGVVILQARLLAMSGAPEVMIVAPMDDGA